MMPLVRRNPPVGKVRCVETTFMPGDTLIWAPTSGRCWIKRPALLRDPLRSSVLWFSTSNFDYCVLSVRGVAITEGAPRLADQLRRRHQVDIENGGRLHWQPLPRRWWDALNGRHCFIAVATP